MIMNGAKDGVAGFGLANTPNLNALLYDPTLPVGQRISILNTTIVARLYHSEATLLPDGRVLVSGSDPQTYAPNGTEIYPEEFRIEVTLPLASPISVLTIIPFRYTSPLTSTRDSLNPSSISRTPTGLMVDSIPSMYNSSRGRRLI